MKKTVLVLAVLMLAVPVMAGVTVTASDTGSGIVQISYAMDGGDANIPRAFALDVSMSPANDSPLAPTGLNPNFYVAPGTFTSDGNHVTSWGNPIVGPNTVGFTTEMGSLWAANDPCGHTTQPPSSGVLFSFVVDKTCDIALAENAARGGVDSNGVVMEDTNKVFPKSYVKLVGCHVNVPPACVTVPNVIGMLPADANTAIIAVGLTVSAATRTYNWDAVQPAGKVCTEPNAGQCLPVGTVIPYTVSRGNQPIDCLANDVNSAFLTTQKTSFTNYVNNKWDPNGWCRFGNVGAPTTAGYQCHGDADGKTTGAPNNQRISSADLNLIVANWQKTLLAYPNGADPRADIDHKSSGAPNNYRVSSADLNRVTANWLRKDLPAVGGLPRNCPLKDAGPDPNNTNYIKP